jgi:hypothetical protein
MLYLNEICAFFIPYFHGVASKQELVRMNIISLTNVYFIIPVSFSSCLLLKLCNLIGYYIWRNVFGNTENISYEIHIWKDNLLTNNDDIKKDSSMKTERLENAKS